MERDHERFEFRSISASNPSLDHTSSEGEAAVIALEQGETTGSRGTQIHPPDGPLGINHSPSGCNWEICCLAETHEMGEFTAISSGNFSELSPVDDDSVIRKGSLKR
jgi:hypothetical protein